MQDAQWVKIDHKYKSYHYKPLLYYPRQNINYFYAQIFIVRTNADYPGIIESFGRRYAGRSSVQSDDRSLLY